MEVIQAFFALTVGLLLRLAIPIAITLLLIVLLRRLDTRWQKEAHLPVLAVQKPECWKVNGCPPEQVANCIGAKSPLPCWQAFRLPNGYLREECLTCKVFTNAPMPTLKIETRRL
jgi:hypothetical protein